MNSSLLFLMHQRPHSRFHMLPVCNSQHYDRAEQINQESTISIFPFKVLTAASRCRSRWLWGWSSARTCRCVRMVRCELGRGARLISRSAPGSTDANRKHTTPAKKTNLPTTSPCLFTKNLAAGLGVWGTERRHQLPGKCHGGSH